MACNFCKAKLYFKTTQSTKPLLAPLTRAEEIRQELLNLTGEVYIQLNNEYCAMCGDKLKQCNRKDNNNEKL